VAETVAGCATGLILKAQILKAQIDDREAKLKEAGSTTSFSKPNGPASQR